MRDRSVSVNQRQYELVPKGTTGLHNGAMYDVYIGYTPDVVGTPLKAGVLLSDAVAAKYELNTAKTNEALCLDTDFPSPNNAFRDVWKYIYPVGTIFETINPNFSTASAVANYFGGTWAALGAGQVLVGHLANDADFGTLSGTGGNRGLQKHTHTVNHGHTVDATGDLTVNVNTLALATSTVADHTHTTPNHTHTMANDSHTHTVTGTTVANGGHDHNVRTVTVYYASGGYSFQADSNTSSYYYGDTDSVADHTHTLSLSAAADSHAHTVNSTGAGTSGVGGTHSHTIDAHAHTLNSHTHNVASANFTSAENTQANGAASNASSGNLQPYYVCYRYVRLT